MMNQIATVNKI